MIIIPKKYQYNDAVKLFKERGYELLSTEDEYQNVGTKLRYICPRHRDKGELLISLGHLQGGRGCTYCGRERTALSKKAVIDRDNDKELCKSKGFEYIDSYVENGKYWIKFICPNHRKLGIQSMTKGNMKRDNIKECQYFRNAPPPWYILNEIHEKSPQIKVLDKIKSLQQKVNCHCDIHDYDYQTNVQSLRQGHGCKYCGIEKNVNSRSYNPDKINEAIKDINPHITVLEYDMPTRTCHCYCNTHGIKFDKNLATLQNSESGCSECYKERMRRDFGKTQEQFEEELFKIHPEIECLGDYITQYDPILFRCNEHNYEFTDSPVNVLGRISCCSKSFVTYKEEEMCQLIESWGYKITRQKTFYDCRDKNPLPFDCYLDDFNVLVEYDGELHYKPIRIIGMSLDEAIEKHEYTKAHDKIKNEYCEKNRIPLVRVPYTEFEYLEQYLFDRFARLGVIEEINQKGA